MDNQDNLPPELINVEAFLSGCLEIEFSELLDTAILYNGATFFVSDGIGTPDSIKLLSSKQIVLCFSKSFLEDKTYGLEFANIGDECGNTLEITDVTFTWSVARKGDIVINELLSNPYHEGADFVELYNKSSKIIHLDHLFISNGKDTIRLNSLLNEEVILAPHNYMVCTKDSLKVVLPYF
jgi:hypothetical protein